MPHVTSHLPGMFCWVELSTTDSAEAKNFYSKLFNWKPEDTPAGPGMIYTLLRVDGKDVAALYQQTEQEKSQSIPPNWLSYFAVTKVEDAMEKAKSLGGHVIAGPVDVGDLGRLAILQDPAGALFAVWQAGKHIGAQIVNEPRSLCWVELMTNDPSKAGEFYAHLFNWDRQNMQMETGNYTVFHGAGQPAAGMMKIATEWGNVPPHWIPYFAVVDCDRSVQTAQQLGGSQKVPPTDIPNIGRFSILSDPQGAVFAIIKLASSKE